jgi:hypothetical protein
MVNGLSSKAYNSEHPLKKAVDALGYGDNGELFRQTWMIRLQDMFVSNGTEMRMSEWLRFFNESADGFKTADKCRVERITKSFSKMPRTDMGDRCHVPSRRP